MSKPEAKSQQPDVLEDDGESELLRNDESQPLRDLRRLVWSFVRQAPKMPNGGERVGEATANVTPWPHQGSSVSAALLALATTVAHR